MSEEQIEWMRQNLKIQAKAVMCPETMTNIMVVKLLIGTEEICLSETNMDSPEMRQS